jgi:DNA-binding CsgD family transcriptional regulator
VTSIPTPLSSVGIVRYHRPTEAFSQVRNDFHRNPSLSLRAYRVAGYILSHADGFVQTQKQIARACSLSVTTVRAALEDLRGSRYLVSARVREHGRYVGTAYAVSDVPFTDAEVNALSGLGTESVHTESVPHKKITTSEKTRKNNPSGGTTAGAAPRSLEPPPIHEQRQEDAVPPPAESLALFDVPAPTKAQKAESPSAKTVVAAYVDSYRQNHSAVDPPKRSIGRVAREAKALLSAADADPGELSAAAAAMGEGQWDNLTMALKIHRERGSRNRTRGALPALPHTHPVWVEIAREEDAKTYQRVLVDDELVRWISGDQSEVDKWIARYPELAARFESVA